MAGYLITKNENTMNKETLKKYGWFTTCLSPESESKDIMEDVEGFCSTRSQLEKAFDLALEDWATCKGFLERSNQLAALSSMNQTKYIRRAIYRHLDNG